MTMKPPMQMSYLVMSASLRDGSLNMRLARLAADIIVDSGAIVEFSSMGEFEAPSFDADVERDEGLPAGASRFRERLEATDAFVVSSPEYNASMPGVLKNTIDWVSRFSPQPFNERQGLLMSASPSMGGGNRGLWALRVPFEHLGARMYPDMFSLAQAHQAFGDDGRLVDAQLQGRLEATISGFTELVEAAKHYPCAKTAWFEYLGEHPDHSFDRVDVPKAS
jgi:chromate reductase, NAD(P)H dehydrogenase (quinone)